MKGIFVKQPIPALLSYGDMVYKPVGYRVPKIGELYVASTGHIKECTNLTHGANIRSDNPMKVKLIVSEHKSGDFDFRVKKDVKT